MEDDLLFTKENTDSIVFSIVKKFKERAKIGKEKYGTDLDRDDLTLNEWLQHAQEEHMDAILYLEKIKKIIDGKIIIEKHNTDELCVDYIDTATSQKISDEMKKTLYAFLVAGFLLLVYDVYCK